MVNLSRRALLWGAGAYATPSFAKEHPRKELVDRLLVLAADMSASVTPERFSLQMKGYQSAFLDPLVERAMMAGSLGSTAVTMVQWAGFGQFVQTLPWVKISGPGECHAIGLHIGRSRRVVAGSTSIAGAAFFGTKLIKSAPFAAARAIIDISGDGYDDFEEMPTADQLRLEEQVRESGEGAVPLRLAREYAFREGVVINGLSIEGAEDAPNLQRYYEENVICGTNAFVVNVEDPDDYEQFSRAIKMKVRRELGS